MSEAIEMVLNIIIGSAFIAVLYGVAYGIL